MDAMSVPQVKGRTTIILAVLSGLSFAFFWSLGFVVALHGIRKGLSPVDVVFHRLFWPGLVFLIFVSRSRFAEFRDLGMARSSLLAILGGPALLLFSYTGFLYTVLGHGAVIQPAASTLMALAFASIWLAERMTSVRYAGALAIVIGLMLLGAEAVLTIGRGGVLGDLSFAAAGTCWAAFGTLVRRWNVDSKRAMVTVNALGVVFYAPLHALVFGFDRMVAVGLFENLLQIVAQGVLAGPVSIYLYTFTAGVLGAGRATTFSTFVPVFTLLMGFFVLSEIPTAVQILGLVVALLGVRLVMARA